MTPLKSTADELADCRRAFEESPQAKLAWCLHHEVHVEPLTESWQNRINYIAKSKPEAERALRFRNFRPVRVELPAPVAAAWAAYYQAGAALNQAGAALDQAGAAYYQARPAYCQAKAVYDQARLAYYQAKAVYDQAGAALNQARAAFNQARAAFNQARAALDQAQAALEPALPALHQLDWPDNSWNGRSIFE